MMLLAASAAAMAPVVAILAPVTVTAVVAHNGDIEPTHDGSYLGNLLRIDWGFDHLIARRGRRCKSRFVLLQEIVPTRNLNNATWRAAAGDEERPAVKSSQPHT